MKIIAIVILLLNAVLISGSAYSQQQDKVKKTPEEFAQKKADMMKKNLSLSDSQYKQMYDLFLNKANERKSNKEKYKDMDKTARKEMRKQNREKFQSRIREILNKEQIEKWDQMKSDRKNKKGKGHRKGDNKNDPDDKSMDQSK
ncbi:MAG TPA: hypothetical protein PKA90_14330 [Ignavibacteria bacterium]|nr:hypothetical protein [Ignavibacteria bacterium]HMR41596.1 hypothetical protein [Ignavibacteria bacterium]